MGKDVSFELKLTTKDLWQFAMYHANQGFMGIFNVIFTVMALFLLITRWAELTVPYRLLLLVGALVFTVWQPFLLYTKAAKQAKTDVIKEPMLLHFTSEGLEVSQSGQNLEFSWDQMGRMDRKPTMVILYMDRVHAYLLPKSVLGEKEEVFYEMVREYLPKERRRKI